MKNTKTKLMSGLGLVGLGVFLFSFGQADEPKFTRIEVIRSVSGEVVTYDTIVDAASGFTAEQYLGLLGFSDDKNIDIISLPHSHEMMMELQSGIAPWGDSMKIVRIGMHSDDPDFQRHHEQRILMHQSGADSLQMFDMKIDTHHAEMMEHYQQLMIGQNIMIQTIDSINQVIVEMQRLVELINLDSLVELHKLYADSAMVFVHEIMLEEVDGRNQQIQETEWGNEHGHPVYERHSHEGNQQMDMVVFDDGKDFTLVIVSDASAQPKSQIKIEQSNVPGEQFKLYPNPASKEVTVQLNFEEKANTNITVSDANGKLVMQVNLGDFSGSHTEIINVSKWSKGIYFVNVERLGTKMVEKLVIE